MEASNAAPCFHIGVQFHCRGRRRKQNRIKCRVSSVQRKRLSADIFPVPRHCARQEGKKIQRVYSIKKSGPLAPPPRSDSKQTGRGTCDVMTYAFSFKVFSGQWSYFDLHNVLGSSCLKLKTQANILLQNKTGLEQRMKRKGKK